MSTALFRLFSNPCEGYVSLSPCLCPSPPPPPAGSRVPHYLIIIPFLIPYVPLILTSPSPIPPSPSVIVTYSLALNPHSSSPAGSSHPIALLLFPLFSSPSNPDVPHPNVHLRQPPTSPFIIANAQGSAPLSFPALSSGTLLHSV